MAVYALPTNIDSSYADSGTDATVALHQQHHDTIHGFVDKFDTAYDPNKAIVTTQAGTTYTLALTDAGTVVEMTSASAVTITVPTNASIAFPVGSLVEICQYGAGQVTISGAGVTLRSPLSMLKIAQQYGSVLLRKRATDEWMIEGDLAP